MFRAENGTQIDVAGIMKQLNGADAGSIDAGLIGNQTDTLTLELSEAIPLENINACQTVASDRMGSTEPVVSESVPAKRTRSKQVLAAR